LLIDISNRETLSEWLGWVKILLRFGFLFVVEQWPGVVARPQRRV